MIPVTQAASEKGNTLFRLPLGNYSQLILLSNEAYAAGFAKLKQDLDEAEAEGRTLQFREDISLVMVIGRKL